MPGSTQLPLWQVLVTTLVVKLAVMAALATMLVRYRRFKHILIFERRGWRDRLTFVLALGLPLTAGVASRLLLNYNAADLTLEGAFLAGLIAGPYAGAIVGQMLRTRRIDWQVVLLFAPVALELLRQALGARWSAHQRLFYAEPIPFWTL